jgi:hypothetical protein
MALREVTSSDEARFQHDPTSDRFQHDPTSDFGWVTKSESKTRRQPVRSTLSTPNPAPPIRSFRILNAQAIKHNFDTRQVAMHADSSLVSFLVPESVVQVS